MKRKGGKRQQDVERVTERQREMTKRRNVAADYVISYPSIRKYAILKGNLKLNLSYRLKTSTGTLSTPITSIIVWKYYNIFLVLGD